MNNIKLPPYSVSEGWIPNRILDIVLKPLGQANCQQKIKPGTLSSSNRSLPPVKNEPTVQDGVC